jgi:hypothetical protein
VNIVNDHGSDRFAAMGLRQQIARQSGSSYVRDVLVLANRCDFILIETAKAEAVFQRNHDQHLHSMARVVDVCSSPCSARVVHAHVQQRHVD